jgi:hypothetical protein
MSSSDELDFLTLYRLNLIPLYVIRESILLPYRDVRDNPILS